MNRLGVCSWSLRPSSPRDLAAAVRECGLDAIQLALEPLRTGEWNTDETLRGLADAGISIYSGMMACRGEDYSTLDSIRLTGGLFPDEHWPANLRAARETAALAARLRLPLVTLHVGFLPESSQGRAHDVIVDRIRQVADLFGNSGVSLAFETGQETAETLAQLLEGLNHPAVGVNFDPANMILYGMGDPTAALERLAPWVRQVHIKDAIPAAVPGTWGTEIPAGSVGGGGDRGVDWTRFLAAVAALPRPVDLMIERESGESRIADITTARRMLERLLGRDPGVGATNV